MIKRQLAIIAVALTALLGLPALTASASPAPAAATKNTNQSCYPGCTPNLVSGGGSQGSGNYSPQPSTVKQSATPANQAVLAFTGADVMVTIAVAGMLLAIGLVLVGLTLRRRTTT